MGPIIGITTSFSDVDDGIGEQQLRLEYVEAVREAGGVPLIIPMTDDAQIIHDLSTLVDALIISGGPAITDGLEGTLPGDLSSNSERRKKADTGLFEEVLRKDKPFLGICYGMQLLNAHHGGTIYADIEDVGTLNTSHLSVANGLRGEIDVNQRLTHSQKRGALTHEIRIFPETHLSAILDDERLTVNTRHLQAIASVGEGLRVSAVAPDGVIEAIESESGRHLGVQFHPERDLEQFLPLFFHLIKLASHKAPAISSS